MVHYFKARNKMLAKLLRTISIIITFSAYIVKSQNSEKTDTIAPNSTNTTEDIENTTLSSFSTVNFEYSFEIYNESNYEKDQAYEKTRYYNRYYYGEESGKYINERDVFVENLKKLNVLNNLTKTAVFKINDFTSIPYIYFVKFYTGFKKDDSEKGVDFMYNESQILPKSFFWHEFGAVALAKNQKNCSNSFVFSAIGAIEGQYEVQQSLATGDVEVERKVTVPLSEQYVFNCMENANCSTGGTPHEVFKSIIEQGGVVAAFNKPNNALGLKEECSNDARNVIVQVTNYTVLNIADEEALKYALAKYGPLSVSMFVSEMVKNYDKGVLIPTDCNNATNHAVLLTGYGVDRGIPYWLIKNSWGQAWGERGFLRLIRGKKACNIGEYAATVQAIMKEPMIIPDNMTNANHTDNSTETQSNETNDNNPKDAPPSISKENNEPKTQNHNNVPKKRKYIRRKIYPIKGLARQTNKKRRERRRGRRRKLQIMSYW